MLTSGETGGIESLCRDIGKYGRLDNAFCFLFKGGFICDQMIKSGINVYNLSGKGNKISLKKLRILKKIAKDFDVVIVHHGDPILKLYFILLNKFISKKGVTMVHSCYGDSSQLDYSGIKLFVYNYVFQKSFDISDEIWFVSRAGQKSCMSKYKIPVKKCFLIYNGISPEFIMKGEKNKLTREKPYNITYIGRLSKEKGLFHLLKAFSIVSEKYDVQLSIIGDGIEKEALEKYADELKIDTKIKFYGQQLNISRYLEGTSIFVYPSTCQEVFGISLIEAMAYGIPCVSNNVGGIPEIISHKKNGYLTSEISAEQLAQGIIFFILCYENNSIEEISYQAKRTAKNFSVCNTCDNIENAIVKLYR